MALQSRRIEVWGAAGFFLAALAGCTRDGESTKRLEALDARVAALEREMCESNPTARLGCAPAVPAALVRALPFSVLTTARMVPETLVDSLRAAPFFNDGRPVGVRLFGVQPGGLGDAIGLRNNDVVTAVDGQAVADQGELHARLVRPELKPGTEVVINVVRQRVPIDVKFKISQ